MEAGRRFSKSVDKPVKTISISKEPASPEKKPANPPAAVAGGKDGESNKPSWVVLAQVVLTSC